MACRICEANTRLVEMELIPESQSHTAEHDKAIGALEKRDEITNSELSSAQAALVLYLFYLLESAGSSWDAFAQLEAFNTFVSFVEVLGTNPDSLSTFANSISTLITNE